MEEKVNKTQKTFEKIVNSLQTIVDSGEYEKFLKFQKKFRKGYSFSNLILIYSQFPDATKVAGKKTWQKLGRKVNNNARRIYIIAPIPRSYTKKVTKIEDGEEIEVLETYKYNYYKYVYVYDISQTEGKAVPLQTNNINSNDMAYFYESLKRFSDVPVIEKELRGTLDGYYDEENSIIAIRDNLSFNDKASVLLHELAHRIYDDFDYKTDRKLSEVFVESIAYIVADHFGLDTSICSFNYIIKWAKGDIKTVIDLGNKIQKCANQFIDKLEKFDTEQLKNIA